MIVIHACPALAKTGKKDLREAFSMGLNIRDIRPEQNNTAGLIKAKAMSATICPPETAVNDRFEDWRPNEKQDTR